MTNGRRNPPPAAPPLPAAPRRKSPPRGVPAGPGGGRPRYVMQVAAKDGQLLSSVVRTLATQR